MTALTRRREFRLKAKQELKADRKRGRRTPFRKFRVSVKLNLDGWVRVHITIPESCMYIVHLLGLICSDKASMV
jgi:hypothetical protein